MAYFVLESRCSQILDYLSSRDEYITTEGLSAALSRSANSIRYSLTKVDALLLERGQGAMEKARGKGGRLTPAQKKWWAQVSKSLSGVDYLFTQEERVAAIICMLLTGGRRFSVDAVARVLKVSRNTLFSDIKAMKELPGLNGAKLLYDQRGGDFLCGDEFALRSLLLRQHSLLLPLVKQNIPDWIDYAELLKHQEALKSLIGSLKDEYSPGLADRLAVILTRVECPCAKEPAFTAAQREEISAYKEYAAVKDIFPALADSEKIYLAAQLIGNRAMCEMRKISPNIKISADSLVVYFERLTGTVLERTEDVALDLARHISRAEWRCKHGISLESAAEDPLSLRRSALFAVVRIAASGLLEELGCPVDDGELLLLTELFHRHLRGEIARTYTRRRPDVSPDAIEDLMLRLKPYLHKDGATKARAEIVSFLSGETYTLRSILRPEYARTGLSASSWEDAVKKSAAPLLKDGAISGGYVDGVIRSVKMYGSYSYIADGVYLAHAEPENNVHRLSMGVSTFAKPVLFPQNKPVRMVALMCPIDKRSHFGAFQELMGVFTGKKAVEALVNASSPEELQKTLFGGPKQ